LVFPKDFFNRNGTLPGPPQWLPWPPCLALFVTTNKQNHLIGPNGATNQWAVVTGRQQVQWAGSTAPTLPCPVCQQKQTDENNDQKMQA